MTRYVNEILNSTAKSVEQVTIEPDGTWSDKSKAASNTPAPRSNNRKIAYEEEDDDDDEDLVVIESMGGKTARQSTHAGTPAATAEPVEPQPSARASTNKRSAEDVIDLTASDDEGPPPPKRAVYYGTPVVGNGVSKSANGVGPASASTATGVGYFGMGPPTTPYNAVNGGPRPAQTL